MLSRRTLLSLLAGAALLRTRGAVAAEGQASGAPKVYLFNIPAQPLRSALITYAAVSGLQIMYDAEQATNLRSRTVVGLFTADTALRMLIGGTDLTVLPAGKDVVLVPVAAIRAGRVPGGGAPDGDGDMTLVLDTLYVSVPPGTQDHPDYNSYGQLVRAEIRKSLGRDSRTARRIYNMDVDIWVGANGRVSETRVTHSSGTQSLDSVLRNVIENIAIRQPPPAGMRQPIHVTVIGI